MGPYSGFEVTGYPKVFFVQKGDIQEVKHRSLEELVSFVDKKGVGIASAVREVDEDSFKKPVLRDHPVLLMTYQPRCPHCIHFAPKFEAFAKALAEERPDVVVARMNALENDIYASANIELQGFPTILYVPRGLSSARVLATGVVDVDLLRKFAMGLGK